MDSVSLRNRMHTALILQNGNLHHIFYSGVFVIFFHGRYALQDMDKFSLKDSGRGDSEAGDSDCDMGRESPVDRLLLGEGFSDLIHLEMHHRLHPGELQETNSHTLPLPSVMTHYHNFSFSFSFLFLVHPSQHDLAINFPLS